MCELCGAQFARSEYRARHIASAHYKGSSCKICFRIFPNNNELQMHMREHTKKKVEETLKIRPDMPKRIKPTIPIGYEQSLLLRKHECDICNRRFIRKQHMIRHRDTHSDIRRYQCACCHKRFSRREYHEKHQSECAKKFNQSCPDIGPIYDSISASENSTAPIIGSGGDEEGTVPISHDIGDSIVDNMEGEMKDGSKTNKLFPCDACERIFTRSDHLKRHRDTHANFRPFNCAYCLRLFSRRENQKRHESLCKQKANGSFGIRDSGSLDFAESSMIDGSDDSFNDDEIGEPSFVGNLDVDGSDCDENDTTADTNGILSVEGNGALYTIISGAKKLKVNSCPICSRDFTRTDHLKRHIQTHDGIKRYQCKCCRKFFARQDYQMKHEKLCMIKNNCAKPSESDEFWKMTGLSNDCPDMSLIPDSQLDDDFSVDSMPEDGHDFDSFLDSVDNNDTKHIMPELSKNESETLSCDTCSRVFQKRHHLRRHKISHMAQKPFQCTDCEQKFTRIEHMKKHVLKRHNKIIKSRNSMEEHINEKFLINKPTLRKKYIHQFTNFAKHFADSTNYFEKCFDFVASLVIAHEKAKFELSPKPMPLPFGKQIKSEPEAEPTGLFINIEECPDPLELYDENDDTL